MPTNKNASFRYRVLNQCFSNRGRRKWTMQELIEEVSRYLQQEFGTDTIVSLRTIQGDINLMRSPQPRGFNAPIVCQKGMYFYSDSNFSIDNPLFSQNDLTLLRECISLVKQLPGMHHLHFLDMLLLRIGENEGLLDLSTDHIQFEMSRITKGSEWIYPVYQAILKEQVLKIQYHPFMEEEMEYIFHPYLLKEWRHRWYLFGMVDSNFSATTSKAENLERMGFIPRRDGIWNIVLDRIFNCVPTNEVVFQSNSFFDPITWFDDIVGVTKPEGVEPFDVEIESDLIASYYIETKPIHHSQRLLNRDAENAVFSFHLIPNNEFINDLIVYGKYIRILGPESFQAMVADRLGDSSLLRSRHMEKAS